MRAPGGFLRSILAALAPLSASLLLFSAAGKTPGATKTPDFLADVDYVCALVAKRYAYYAQRKNTWPQACAAARKQAVHVSTPGQHLDLIEHLLEALYDSHVSLGINSGHSPRLVPSGADMWLADKDGAVTVTAVRAGGAAARAGIRVGDMVLSINGMPFKSAAQRRLDRVARKPSAVQWAWALNAVAAGYHNQPRSLVVERAGARFHVVLGDPQPQRPEEPVTARMLAHNIGYIRFNNSLGRNDTVKAFDKAAQALEGAKGWIVDLRDTPGGGNTDVAEPILGRFITRAQPYQATVYPGEKPRLRVVVPRGPWTLNGPLAVLVGRWTGSMGEGMAIGLDGMKRGLVMGSPMAGLAGGTETFTLPESGFPLHLPTYDLTHVDGTPRYLWRPPLMLRADNGDAADVALAQAIRHVRRPP